MNIELTQVGKRFRYEWIFQNVQQTFLSGERYAITGPNGAGKSTLMRILSGHLTPSVGKAVFKDTEGKPTHPDDVYLHVSFAAPYIELVEELSLVEILNFHQQFKPFQNDLTTRDALQLLGFANSAAQKPVKFFSSGMKQRVKLLLALAAQTPIVLLDEPTTNLDAQGAEWYHQLVTQFANDRLIVVASNVEQDFKFCEYHLNILDFKK
jgi:ABC-type multidrug transport system ATPase subunit